MAEIFLKIVQNFFRGFEAIIENQTLENYGYRVSAIFSNQRREFFPAVIAKIKLNFLQLLFSLPKFYNIGSMAVRAN